MTNTTLSKTGYLRLSQIIGKKGEPGIIPVSRSAWYAGIKTGRFPKPVKLGPRLAAWRAEDIREYFEKVNKQQSKLNSPTYLVGRNEIQVLANMDLILENMTKTSPGHETVKFRWLELIDQVRTLRERQNSVVANL